MESWKVVIRCSHLARSRIRLYNNKLLRSAHPECTRTNNRTRPLPRPPVDVTTLWIIYRITHTHARAPTPTHARTTTHARTHTIAYNGSVITYVSINTRCGFIQPNLCYVTSNSCFIYILHTSPQGNIVIDSMTMHV